MNRNRFSLLLVVLCLAWLPLMAAEEGTFDRTLKVTGPVDLEVTTGSGSITVNRGGDGQVEVHAVIRASDSWFSGDPAARIKDIQNNPPIEQSGNVIRIGHSNDSSLLRNVSISYDIQVPAATNLRAHSGSGHARVSGINGPVEVTTGSGGMDVADIGSDARLETGSGGISVNNVAGQVRAHAGSGSIRGGNLGGGSAVNTSAKFQGKALPLMSSGTRTAGAAYLDFETGSGSIHLDNVAGEVKARTGSGSIEIQGQQAGNWEMSTGSGGIRVQLPDNAKFNLMARTSSGSVSTDFPITVQGTVNRHELNGPVNGGGPDLELRTGSGSIRITKEGFSSHAKSARYCFPPVGNGVRFGFAEIYRSTSDQPPNLDFASPHGLTSRHDHGEPSDHSDYGFWRQRLLRGRDEGRNPQHQPAGADRRHLQFGPVL